MKALRLTSPADNNAMDKYNEVLALDAGNARALAGFGDVLSADSKLAEQSGERGALRGPRRWVQKGSAAVFFLMGSPSSEPQRDSAERQHRP